MIALFAKVLPYILLGYFLYRFTKEPIYLLGIAFILFFRQSLFVDKAFIFVQPGTWDNELKFIGWLFFIWVSISLKLQLNNQFSDLKIEKRWDKNIIDYVAIVLIGLTFIGFITALSDYFINDNIYTEFFTLSALFFGLFILKDIFMNFSAKEISEFLFNIVLINSLASILYIMHQGLHINIYGENREYLSLNFQGELITRTFTFMPVLWFFSISYLLIFKRKKNIINLGLLAINALAIFISYTRSFLLIAFIVYLLYSLLTTLKSRQYDKLIKNLFLVSVAGVAFFFTVSIAFPASTKYFIGRFMELDQRPSNAESNNLVYRFYRTNEVINQIGPAKSLLGYGSVTETQMPSVTHMKAVTADMAWTEVVFRWGFAGLILFLLLFIGAAIKAFYLYIKTDGIFSDLALLSLLTVISQVIESFTSWTFMSPNRFVMSFWYFGLLSALIVSYKKTETQISETTEKY